MMSRTGGGASSHAARAASTGAAIAARQSSAGSQMKPRRLGAGDGETSMNRSLLRPRQRRKAAWAVDHGARPAGATASIGRRIRWFVNVRPGDKSVDEMIRPDAPSLPPRRHGAAITAPTASHARLKPADVRHKTNAVSCSNAEIFGFIT